MKKVLKSGISLILATSALFAVACSSEPASQLLPPYDSREFTEFVLADNGTTDYKIVIEEDATFFEEFAAKELQFFFEDATGAKLPIVYEDEVSYSETAKVLSIGDTTFQQASGVTAEYSELGDSGNKVVTKGNSMILTGAGKRGSLYAVYDFLKYTFNYEFYEKDTWVIDKVEKAFLPNVEQTNIPSFDDVRFGDYSHYDNLGGDVRTAYRQRIHFVDDEMSIGGHIPATLLPYETYGAEHPDWYSGPGDSEWQLCYSNEEMLLEYVERHKQYILANPNSAIASMCDRDYNTWCACENCKAIMASYNLYDSNNNLLMECPEGITGILFKSKAADMLDAWLETEHPEIHMTYYAHAYFKQRTPPVYQNADGSFTLLTNGKGDDDPLKHLNPNLQWQVAAIEANRNFSWEDNASQGTELKKWSVVSNNVIVYEYPQDAANCLLPYDGIHVHADNMRFAKSLGHKAYLFQGNYNTQSGGFYDLRKYVISKLAWNVNYDVDTLINDYMNACFGPAAEPMNELYKSMRARMAYLRENGNYGGHVLGQNIKTVNFPRALVLVWEDLTDKAYDAIAYLKYENPEYYARLFRRIKIEDLTLQYINLSLYRTYYATEDKMALIEEFEYYSKQYGATLYHEAKPMADLITQWKNS